MSRIALMFPGQGSQYIGMCKDLYDKHCIVRKTFEEAGEVLGIDLKKLCFDSDIKELTKTSNTQIALLTASVAMFRLFMENTPIQPYCLVGHSLGEISALTCAGAIKFSDALKIVRKRGQLMEEISESGYGIMAAVSNIDSQLIRECLDNSKYDSGVVELACNNSYKQNVISGEEKLVKAICSHLEEKGANIKYLNVSGAFHSKLMESAAIKFEAELRCYSYNDLRWPVISNVNAKKYNNKNDIINNLRRQLISPVLWVEIMEEMSRNNVNMCIELGPKKTLKNLLNQSIQGIQVYSFDNLEDREYLLNELVNEYGAETFVRKCLSISICTENNNWNNKEYENYVAKPINRIKELYAICKVENINEFNVMKEALYLLRCILSNKMISINEQISRLKSLKRYTLDSNMLNQINIEINQIN
ncbi:ACP S-malonyltransferase [Clostridium butyricum]|nr:ACP S-malonyltransferase [Clostridium butyricum]